MEIKPDPDAPLVPLSGDEVVSVLHRRQASKRKKASTKKMAKRKSMEFELRCLKKWAFEGCECFRPQAPGHCLSLRGREGLATGGSEEEHPSHPGFTEKAETSGG